MKPMHIMWLGLRGFPNVQGGIETHAQNLCPWLTQMGCDVTVVVRSCYQPTEVGPEWKGVRFKHIWTPRSKHLEAVVHTFLGVLYAAVKRPDILHIQAIGPGLMTPLARLLGLRVVVTHHGPDYDRQKWGRMAKAILQLGEYFAMRFSTARIAISDVIRKLVHDKHGVHCALIPNGVEMPSPHRGMETLDRFGLEPKRYVLLVSRFVPEKRHHDLIQAFQRAALPGWKLALVGSSDHPDDYTLSVLDAAKACKDIVCTGFQTGLALKEIYQNAGIFVLPSSHEGLPIALLEAMSYGLPAIASDIAPHLEINCDDIDHYPLGDVDALAALLRLRAAEAAELGRGERVRQFVLERYKWRDVASRTYELYNDVISGGGRVAAKTETVTAKTV